MIVAQFQKLLTSDVVLVLLVKEVALQLGDLGDLMADVSVFLIQMQFKKADGMLVLLILELNLLVSLHDGLLSLLAF